METQRNDLQTTHLRWPPPGLEPLHGRLLPAVGLLGLADIVLVLPLMSAFATRQDFWSAGVLGSEWWVSAVIVALGLFLMLVGFGRIRKILKAARSGAALGHSFKTMVLAASDSSRDTGFLLQGARMFHGASTAQRDLVVRARLVRAVTYLGAVMWPPVFLALGLMGASRGLIGPTALWFVVVVLPLLAVVVALFFGVGELWAVWTISKGAGSAADHAENRKTVDEWYGDLASVSGEATSRGSENLAGRVRVSYIAIGIVGVLIAIPVGAVAFAGSIGPIMAAIAIPSMRGLQSVREADALRRYRLPSDSAITEVAAGQAVQALMSVGGAQDTTTLLPPVRVYEAGWFPDSSPETLDFTGLASSSGCSKAWEVDPSPCSLRVAALFSRMRTLSSAELRYLEDVASHPAQSEWAILGRAVAADIVATRYRLPFADGVDPFSLKWPRFSALVRGGTARIGAAVLEASRGRTARAEEMILEVMSAGFLLIDDGRLYFDNFFGAGLVALAGDALTELYRATGRDAEADALEWMRIEMAGTTKAPSYTGRFRSDDAYREMMAMVEDSQVISGVRWERFLLVNTMAPCMNLNKVVFGSGEAFDAWLERARESLVVHPGDERFFQLYRYGVWGTGGAGEHYSGAFVPWLTRMMFGSGGGMYDCVSRLAVL